MFYVTPNLRFRFMHIPGGDQCDRITLSVIEHKLTDEDDWFPVVRGEAKCSKEDSFCRATGRKLSLTRALRQAKYSINKETRTKIWETYFSKVNDLRKE